MYRVVLTCWDFDDLPYADDLAGVKLSLFATEAEAQAAVERQVKEELTVLNWLDDDVPREKEPVMDSDGNVVGYDYPFRGDDSGDHANIVRLWRGDDYEEVTAYDIYELRGDKDTLDECSYYKYRGFWIVPDETRTLFEVSQFNTTVFRRETLADALMEVDDFVCKMQYGKPSLEARLVQAALAAEEFSNEGFIKEATAEFVKD